jgi:hypothetical protein
VHFSSKENLLLCVRIAKSADPEYNGFLKKNIKVWRHVSPKIKINDIVFVSLAFYFHETIFVGEAWRPC